MLATKFKAITDRLPKEKNVDEDLLYSIPFFLFSTIKEKMPMLDEFSLYIEGMGIFFHRQKKLAEEKHQINLQLDHTYLEPEKRVYFEERLKKIERLEELYVKYIFERKAARDKRHEV